MNQIHDGGPAFPEVPGECNVYQGKPGMTLRDYFAAKAMQGICAHTDTWGLLMPEITERAYEMADAMLRAREVSQ
ncbi:hypothetical protein KTE91_33165 [Burkholderia multivorans]|uniref:hypothetical protein n=1 Tax=Burkholderia multivorans TaxID=87883 RepID=UPI001C227435|nr:hypothetical protein [Burkholderia multivorans]MBU9439927.1 hypothetical protein [Burkholderia multivorans]